MANVYLKAQLSTNIPRRVKILKRWGKKQKTDFTTKEPSFDKMGNPVYEYGYDLDLDGQLVKHYASQYEENDLSLFREGETVQVVRGEKEGQNGKRFATMTWTTTSGAEAQAAATPKLHSNTHELRTAPKQEEQRNLAEATRDWKLGLAGVTQAMLSSGKYTSDEIRDAAPKWAKWIRETAEQLAILND